ncbi:FAD-binding oxidoreductase [Komagataeibacter sp. FNDCF1]|uniref:NAD(P)/FAD-dependent oxidoreductase n=1 Tax=Komagataeibacter sp. FNDCF1 TaxID=2878681 RepID=UPI001E2DB20D|nr:FAD-binding oxidoreductase [Komagataeibacter sp. FNDCF1]MCE2563288.1 FAD-binding oxidoreductase [Komagataeibacter sp. FNDCF1]
MVPNSGRASSAVVVGGGVVGLACALRLRSRGIRVCIINDGAPTDAASWGNAGHIATEQVMPLATPRMVLSAPRRMFALTGGALDIGWRYPGTWLPWCLRYLHACTPAMARRGQAALRRVLADALPAWRRMVADIGAQDLLIEGGHLMVWQGQDDPAAAMRAIMQDDMGTATARPMTAGERDALSGLLGAAPRGGLVFSGTGQVAAPGRVLEALRAHLSADAGCEILSARVAEVMSTAAGPVACLADGTRRASDIVVLAAGIGTRGLVRGWTPPLIAERGYSIEWDHGGAPAVPPMVFADHSYIVTRFGARMRASTFVEFTRPDAAPDPRKWACLERRVRESGLPVHSAFSRWIGSRPTLPDYLPAIGPLPGMPGVIAACGHQHLGLTLAPLTGELVAALAIGAAPGSLIRPFRPDRFGS